MKSITEYELKLRDTLQIIKFIRSNSNPSKIFYNIKNIGVIIVN